MWPFKRVEKRESSFTDLLVSLAVSRASGTTEARVTATGALQAAAGLLGRCFALADVSGPAHVTAAVTAPCLAMVGRALVRAGEIVMAIDVDPEGGVRLQPSSHWDVQGEPDPASWRYRCNLPAPSSTVTRMLPAESVCHFMFEADPGRPWEGVSPLQSAALAGRLSAETAAALADESTMPRGAVLPLPVDGEDESVTALKADLKTLSGKLALVESVKTMHPGAASTAPAADWEAKRIGADPPPSLVSLHGAAAAEVLGACGVPVSLFVADNSQGQREAFRRYLHSTVQPLASLVAAELSAKMDADVSLGFDRLFAADLSGRARAFQSLVGGGMDPGKAAGLAGLMESDG